LTVSIAIFALGKWRRLRERPARLVDFAVLLAAAWWIIDTTFDVRARIFEALGRDAGLTNRTFIWQVLLDINTEPWLIGAGFMSFWSGDRVVAFVRAVGAEVNQAHNGYLEQFLNLGAIGVAFMILLFLSSLWRVRRCDPDEWQFAILRLALLLSAILYNYTEASFYGISNVWLLTLVTFVSIAPGTCATDAKAKTQAPIELPRRAETRPFCRRNTPEELRRGSRSYRGLRL
jgi:O-antigen ligase